MSFLLGMIFMYLNTAAIAFWREKQRSKRWGTTFDTWSEAKECLLWIRWFA